MTPNIQMDAVVPVHILYHKLAFSIARIQQLWFEMARLVHVVVYIVRRWTLLDSSWRTVQYTTYKTKVLLQIFLYWTKQINLIEQCRKSEK